MTQCRARNRTGTQCRRHAIQGGAVCRFHGGAAPQVVEKARQRLLAAMDPAAAELVRIAREGADEAVRVRAIKEILDRAGLPAVSQTEVSSPGGEPLRVVISPQLLKKPGAE